MKNDFLIAETACSHNGDIKELKRLFASAATDCEERRGAQNEITRSARKNLFLNIFLLSGC